MFAGLRVLGISSDGLAASTAISIGGAINTKNAEVILSTNIDDSTTNYGSIVLGSSIAGNAITLTAEYGDISDTTEGASFGTSNSDAGGDITITTMNGKIDLSTVNINTIGSSGNGGNVSVSITDSDASGNILLYSINAKGSSSSGSGDGGDVTITNAGSGGVTITSVISASAITAGSGGNVTISANGGQINLSSYIATTVSGENNSGGDIRISNTTGAIIANYCICIQADSMQGSSGNVTLEITDSDATAAISITTINARGSRSGGSGDGGAVTITNAGSGTVTVGDIDATAVTSGAGGNVSISAVKGTLASVGAIKTSGTVTVNVNKLGGNIGDIGADGCDAAGVDITIGDVVGAARTIGNITTAANNGNVTITASTTEAAGNDLTVGDISAGIGDITLDASGMYNDFETGALSGNNIIITASANNGITTVGAVTFAAGATLSISGTGNVNLGALNSAADHIINIGAGTGVVFSAASDLTAAAGNKLYLDFGSDEGTNDTAASGTYAVLMSAGNLTVSKDGNTVEQLYGTNGVVGLTYENVMDSNTLGGGVTLESGDVLSTDDDEIRTYTVALNGTVVNIKVTSVNQGEYEVVKGGGGSDAAARAGQYLVDHQAEFDSAGQSYTAGLSALRGSAAARAAEQTIGEGATAPAINTSLITVTAASGTVANQMVSFRSGNIASGMASSFGGGGATTALSDMADADTLAAAYESGFTSGVDTTEYKKVSVWANGFGGFGQQGTVDNNIGYDFWNAGTMVGLDYAFARELRIGGLFGYSFNKTDLYWNSGDSRDNALRLGAYSSFNWDNFFVDFSPTLGIHMIDSNRNIWNGSVAKSERTALDFNVNGSVGYNFTLPYEINLAPTYSLNYTLFNDPKYSETGAGAANVTYGSYTSNSLVQDIGLKIGKLFRVSDDLSFLPEVWGGWEFEYLDTGGTRNNVTSASIGAQSYATEMNAMAKSRGYWGLGITALIKDNVSVYGRYDHKIWENGFNVNFLAGIKVDF